MKNAILMRLALLALAATVSVTGAETKKGAAGALPAPAEILEKYIEKLGGRDAFKEIRSQHVKGSYEMPAQGLKGEVEIFNSRPDKMFVKINLGALGEILTGHYNDVVWLMNPATGPMVLDGKAAEQIKDQADFDAMLHEPSQYKEMATLERTTFEGRETFKVKLVKNSGLESTEYFDVTTGLLAGFAAVQESIAGPVETMNSIREYKNFGKVKLPSLVVQKIGPIEMRMTVTSVEFNTVDDKVFELPEAVKAIRAGRK